MSQHPSLRSLAKDKQHRSVLKRYERIKILKDKEKWTAESSVFGLQKVKIVRFKIKKEKAAAAEGTEAGAAPAAGAAAPSAPQAQAGAKPLPASGGRAPAKGGAGKQAAKS